MVITIRAQTREIHRIEVAWDTAGLGPGERQIAVVYYNAWYRKDSEGASLDANFPDWVVYAMDSEDAQSKVLECIRRTEPERGFRVFLTPINDEDAGTVAFAMARQSGQALR